MMSIYRCRRNCEGGNNVRNWMRLQKNGKNPHFCDTHTGRSFFFECLKDPNCNVNWKTATSRCSNCNMLLRPPKLLSMYYYFNPGWQKWFAFFVGDVLASMLGLFFPVNVLFMCSCYFIAGHLIPAVLAVSGTWESFSLQGLSPDEALEVQRSTIERRNKSPYHRAVRVVLFIIIIILGGYARVLRQ